MSNYTQLLADITLFTARSDVPAHMFVALAEREMNRILRVQGMESMSQASPVNQTDNGLYYLTYPADLLELKHIESGEQRLEFVSNNQMNVDLDGAYTLANELILVNSIDEIDIYYWATVPALSHTNQTNLFTTIGYDALLSLSLDWAAKYMREPSDWRQAAMIRLDEIQSMDNQASVAGAPLVQRG